jgi:hypothetical protein
MGVTAWSITQNGLHEPFELQVARDQISWHKTVLVSGYSGATSTSYQTIWSQNTLYSYPASATVMTVSSSSASDTAAGTGARTVYINGLDANYNEISETVTLNGTSGVNTVNSYLRMFHVMVATAGSGGAAVGAIYVGTGTITAGVPANVYGVYGANGGSTACIWTVPAGYTAHIVSAAIAAGCTTANAFTSLGLYNRPLGGVFDNTVQGRCANGAPFAIPFFYPISFPEKTDLEIRAASTTASSVSAQMQIVYIKNDANA